jgi:hypothetical protein
MTTYQCELPASITLEREARDKVSKTVVWTFNRTIDLADVAAFPPHVRTELALYGIRQKLGDCMASAKTADEAKELFEDMFGKLASGVWRKGGGGRKGDDAWNVIRPLLLKHVQKTEPSITEAKDMLARAKALFESEPKWRAKAELMLEAFED